MVPSPTEASQAKPASKPTPPNKVRAELEASGGGEEPREVENQVYMFDTESEDEEEVEKPSASLFNDKTKGKVKEETVDEFEMTMRNMGKRFCGNDVILCHNVCVWPFAADDLNNFLEGPGFPTTKTAPAAATKKTSM